MTTSYRASLRITIDEGMDFNMREHEGAVLRQALAAAGAAYVAELTKLDQYTDNAAVVRVETADEEHIVGERSRFSVGRKAGPIAVVLELSGHLQGPRTDAQATETG